MRSPITVSLCFILVCTINWIRCNNWIASSIINLHIFFKCNIANLIRDKKDKSIYRFLQIKEEIMEEVPKEVEDPDTHEVRTETE